MTFANNLDPDQARQNVWIETVWQNVWIETVWLSDGTPDLKKVEKNGEKCQMFLPSRHITLKQRLIDVNATWRSIGVDMTFMVVCLLGSLKELNLHWGYLSRSRCAGSSLCYKYYRMLTAVLSHNRTQTPQQWRPLAVILPCFLREGLLEDATVGEFELNQIMWLGVT